MIMVVGNVAAGGAEPDSAGGGEFVVEGHEGCRLVRLMADDRALAGVLCFPIRIAFTGDPQMQPVQEIRLCSVTQGSLCLQDYGFCWA